MVEKVNGIPVNFPGWPLPASCCVYPNLGHVVAATRKDPALHVTTVAGCFPTSQSWLEVKLKEIELAVRGGADEIDIVLALNTFLAGDYVAAGAEIKASRECIDRVAAELGRPVVLKVILETGLLVTPELIADASFLAMENGADFIKTEEVISLPEQSFIRCSQPIPKQYRQLLKDGHTIINDEEVIADNPLKKLLYLRGICATSDERMKALSDLLESTSKRVVVFYNFNAELFAMKKIVGERRVSVVNGTMKDMTNFMNHEYSVLFVQYQSGAMGLNLQIANIIIYNSLPLSSELYEQSKKRIHRVSQTRPCFYYILKCAGSVEDNIERTLNLRRDYTNALFESEFKC